MAVKSMDESDSIWQWCNARRKNCKGRQETIVFASDTFSSRGSRSSFCRGSNLKQQKGSNFKKTQRSGKSSQEPVFPCDFSFEYKKSDGQCLFLVLDPLEHPTTPDLDNAVLEAGRNPEKLKARRGIRRSGVASTSSSSVLEEASTVSSACASSVHDKVPECMHLQSRIFSSQPTSSYKDLGQDELGSLLQTSKFATRDVRRQAKSLARKQTLNSEMPIKEFLSKLHAVGSKKDKPKTSLEGLDLLIGAIHVLESDHTGFVDQISYNGDKGLQASEQCFRKPFLIHAGLKKKRVLRRAKSAYKRQGNNTDGIQVHDKELLMAADSNSDLKGNHLCELSVVQIVKHEENQSFGRISEAENDDRLVQPPFSSKLRRSRASNSKRHGSILHPRKKGATR